MHKVLRKMYEITYRIVRLVGNFSTRQKKSFLSRFIHNIPGSKMITKRRPKKDMDILFGCPKGNFLYHLCPLLWQLVAVRMASNRQRISVIKMPTNSHRLSVAYTVT